MKYITLLTVASLISFSNAASLIIEINQKKISISGNGTITGTLMSAVPSLTSTNGLWFQDEMNFAGGRDINFMSIGDAPPPSSSVYSLSHAFIPVQAHGSPSPNVNLTGSLVQGSLPSSLYLLSNYQFFWSDQPTFNLSGISATYEFSQNMENLLVPGSYVAGTGPQQFISEVRVVPEASSALYGLLSAVALLTQRRRSTRNLLQE